MLSRKTRTSAINNSPDPPFINPTRHVAQKPTSQGASQRANRRDSITGLEPGTPISAPEQYPPSVGFGG